MFRWAGDVWRGSAIALFALVGSTTTTWAAPETFNTALPVAKGEFLFGEQFLYKRASDDPSPADQFDLLLVEPHASKLAESPLFDEGHGALISLRDSVGLG